jgi:membrane protein YdbS with pleckstrin-like domain
VIDTLTATALLLGIAAGVSLFALLVSPHPAWVTWLAVAVVTTVLGALCTLWAVVRLAEARLADRLDALRVSRDPS